MSKPGHFVPEKPDSAGERRASVREPYYSETLCHPVSELGHELWWQATVQDLSARGVGLVLGRWFGPGTLLEVELQNTSRCYSVVVKARVRHAHPIPPGGLWDVGCAFLEELNDEQRLALL